jgi:hypothetical protein
MASSGSARVGASQNKWLHGGTLFSSSLGVSLVAKYWDELSIQLTPLNSVIAMKGEHYRRLDAGAISYIISRFQ